MLREDVVEPVAVIAPRLPSDSGCPGVSIGISGWYRCRCAPNATAPPNKTISPTSRNLTPFTCQPPISSHVANPLPAHVASGSPTGGSCGRLDVLIQTEEVVRIIRVLQGHQAIVTFPISRPGPLLTLLAKKIHIG